MDLESLTFGSLDLLNCRLNREDSIMNDTSVPDESSIPDNAQLAQWHDEAAAAAATPDLHERVRELTARALHDRRMQLNELRAIVGAISSGVGSGLSARGGEMKEGLKQAVSGLDEAIGSAAQNASYTLREAISQGKAFKDDELKTSLEQLRDLETQFVDTLKQTARQSGGKLKEELEYLSDHLKHSGTRTGEQVREALQQMVSGLKSTGEAGRAGLSESAGAATERLSMVASGVLEALSDSLKRQSDRLRS
jgi:gas vesicle protein